MRVVLAMGKFDGVHRGHQQVLREAVALAKKKGVASVALTFDRNPAAVIDPHAAPQVLTPLERKRALIEGLGVDRLVVWAFTEALMQMEPEDFLKMIARRLKPVAIVCGENFSFGRGARGDVKMLRAMAESLQYEPVVVPMYEVDGEPASSTRVRALIKEGDVFAAERLLGRTYQTEE